MSISRRELLGMGTAAVIGAGMMRGAEQALENAPEQNPELVPAEGPAGKQGKLAAALADLGKYVFLAPTKFGGGSYAVDLSTGRTLAWIEYWNYGDTCPISHHLAAFPSPDPYKGFEFINSTQGGKNLFVFGLPTKVKDPGPGFNIYKVRYDGTQMVLVENVAETTGLGLGVHVTIAPEATSYGVADGQKDIAAIFDRESSKVIACFGFDWVPKAGNLKEAWTGGGTLKMFRMHPNEVTGKFDYEGLKGCKIDWEIVPGGELQIENGHTPGPAPEKVAGSDPWIFDPRGRWAIVGIRLAGVGIVCDRKNNYEPVVAVSGPKGSPELFQLKKTGDESWEIEFDQVLSPVHEAGFSPDGKWFLFMNTTRQNNVAVFDTRDPDPRKWKRTNFVEHPDWTGTYPNPFHLMFSPNGKKVYCAVWYQPNQPSHLAVIDVATWKVVKQIETVGKDLQTVCMTYDGKYLLGVFSGGQRYESGIFILDATTDEPYGYLPSPGGHHDCVIIPRNLEDLRNSRSTTV